MGELYKLTFSNGKAYIGLSTASAATRYKQHSLVVKVSNCLVHRAWRKYGAPTMRVLATIKSLKGLQKAEVLAIKNHHTLAPNGYNLTTGGDASPTESVVVRIKISKARLRQWKDPVYRRKQKRSLAFSRKIGRKLARLWKDPVFRRKQMRKRRKASYKRKCSLTAKRFWKRHPDRSKSRKAMKKLWRNPKFRRKVSKFVSRTLKKRWKQSKYKRIMRKALRVCKIKQWRDPLYRHKMELLNKDPKRLRKIRATTKRQWAATKKAGRNVL